MSKIYIQSPQQLTPENIVDAYRSSCEKQGIKPIPHLINQFETASAFDIREEDLNLNGEKLDFRQCEALEEILKRIQFRTINLESCNLDDEGASALFDMIEYYESATHLNISNNKNIDIRGWQACCRMLKNTSSLQHLDLRNSGLSEQVMLTFGRALRLGSHLITLHLENSGISSRALAILIAALKLNTTLKELYLGENKLNQTDAIQIGNLLKANSTLELLDLRGNQLQDIGLSYVTEGLSQQPVSAGEGLKTLILCDNQITAKGMPYLSEVLPLCRELKGLNLGFNNIGNDGVIRLKEGLLNCSTLLYLGLRHTKITCEGAISLAEYIAENKKVQKLDLRENNIQSAGLMALAIAMKHNTNITRLHISSPISTKDSSTSESCQKFLDEIDACIASNCELDNGCETDEDYIQSLESPTASPNESSGVSHFTFNGIFRKPVFNISLPNISKKDKKASSPSSKPRFRVSRVCVENEEIVPIVDKLVRSQSRNSTEIYTNGYNKCLNTQQQQQQVSQPKPILRSTSFGSWDTRYSEKETRRSGRFSVSPVPDSDFNNSQVKRLQEEEEVKSEISSSPEVMAQEEVLVASSEVQENENISNVNEDENVQKSKRKISFLLPESKDSTSSTSNFNKNRRMSTPATSAVKTPRSRVPSLKMFKTLDSLDLKSSVPLSPTRLLQGW
ncbi:protein phosphatase 1 regulatory subunit 37-like protein, partial [Dinothrombium tinctorium]